MILQYHNIIMKKRRAKSREDMVVTTVALPQKLHRCLAILAIEENAASAELIREAIQEYLDRRERQRKGRRSQ
jgi:predicted transcriptional regulator